MINPPLIFRYRLLGFQVLGKGWVSFKYQAINLITNDTFNNLSPTDFSQFTNLLDRNYIAGLNDDKVVDLFLHGDQALSFETNTSIISLAQTFIVDSKRFNMRILQ